MVSTFGVSHAKAYQSSAELLSECESEHVFENYGCLNFIKGVHRALDGTQWHYPNDVYCAPPSITNGQLKKIYEKYANNWPEYLHKDAANEVIVSLRYAFPCPS